MTSNPYEAPKEKSEITGDETSEQVIRVGKQQRAIMWLILAAILTFLVPLAGLITGIIMIVFVYRFASAMKWPVAWLWAILSFLPLINLLILVTLNGRATKLLRANGIRVGLMGANKSDMAKLRAA